jgi:hypothetical protein
VLATDASHLSIIDPSGFKDAGREKGAGAALRPRCRRRLQSRDRLGLNNGVFQLAIVHRVGGGVEAIVKPYDASESKYGQAIVSAQGFVRTRKKLRAEAIVSPVAEAKSAAESRLSDNA